SDLTVFGWTFWTDPETEERPLAEWLKLHLTNQMTFLEAMQQEVDSIQASWIEQKTSPIAPAPREIMQIGFDSQSNLNMLNDRLKAIRPKLEDQDETDFANNLEAKIKSVGAEIMREVYDYSQQSSEGQETLLDDLKKG